MYNLHTIRFIIPIIYKLNHHIWWQIGFDAYNGTAALYIALSYGQWFSKISILEATPSVVFRPEWGLLDVGSGVASYKGRGPTGTLFLLPSTARPQSYPQ